jgi:hypothetical protein
MNLLNDICRWNVKNVSCPRPVFVTFSVLNAFSGRKYKAEEIGICCIGEATFWNISEQEANNSDFQ